MFPSLSMFPMLTSCRLSADDLRPEESNTTISTGQHRRVFRAHNKAHGIAFSRPTHEVGQAIGLEARQRGNEGPGAFAYRPGKRALPEKWPADRQLGRMFREIRRQRSKKPPPETMRRRFSVSPLRNLTWALTRHLRRRRRHWRSQLLPLVLLSLAGLRRQGPSP